MRSFSFFRFFVFCIIPAFFYAASLTLINDSSYELTAIVRGADGTFLGQLTIQPGEQKLWSQDLSSFELQVPNAPVVSITPYTVVWKCSHQGIYSMCTNVATGSIVTANSCPGNYFCSPNDEETKNENKGSSEQK